MFRSQTPINRKPQQDSIVLACLRSGVHVQVGNPQTEAGAMALHTVLDQAQTGYRRTTQGTLQSPEPGSQQVHTILGAEVSFYRVRTGTHEFGSIAQVPVNRIAGVKLATK